MPAFVTAEPIGPAGQAVSHAFGRLARQMHRDNLFLRDPEALGYCEQVPSARSGDRGLLALLSAGVQADMAAGDLWCDFSRQVLQKPDGIARARGLGMRVITGLPHDDMVRTLDNTADIIRLGPEWETGSLTALAGTAALLKGLCQRITGQGSAIWLAGVTSPQTLDAALDAGVTHVSGDWLARPVVAGCVSGWRPLNADVMRRDTRDAVVALRRRG